MPIRVTLNETLDICVTRVNGHVYAIEDRCGHMNGPLSRGEIDGDVVSCPMHAARFSLVTGEMISPPVSLALQAAAVAAAPVAVGAGVGAGVAVAELVQAAPEPPRPPVNPAMAGIRAMVKAEGGELYLDLP